MMGSRRILLVVSGGIAAYKAPDLVRALRKDSHEVRCILTRAAGRFVAPLALEIVSGQRVRSELFAAAEEGEVDHIALADWAEAVVVAPATADLLARMAHGLADDLATTLLLATRAEIVAAPSMNVNMWRHPATRANVGTLRERGVRFVGPDAGFLACGWEGEGRMSEPAEIAGAVRLALGTRSLAGVRVLVTAGGTREAIDPVRAITNRSSGKMGFAVAAEAARRGAVVALVAGPSAEPTPPGVERIDVESARDMLEAVRARLADSDVVVKAAAVADFRPAAVADRKIKKESLADGAGLSLQLVRNPDILSEVSRARGDRIVVGFAAESHDLLAAARRKLERKGCDLIVANDVSREGAGFDGDTNAVVLVWPGGQVEELPVLPKTEVAAQLLDRVEKLRSQPR